MDDTKIVTAEEVMELMYLLHGRISVLENEMIELRNRLGLDQ